MNSLLYQLVHETLISESASTAKMADARNLALAIFKTNDELKAYVLFDRNAFVRVLMDVIRNEIQHYVGNRDDGSKYTVKDFFQLYQWARVHIFPVSSRYSEFIIAGTTAINFRELERGKANKAWYLHEPVATEKYGPLLYDIVMADRGELMPDRGSVTSSARSVWKHYKEKRPDVVSTPLDNIENPQTPSKRDDAPVHFTDPDDFGNFLDSSYHHSGPGPDVNKLKLSYSQLLKNLKLKIGFEKYDIERVLISAYEQFYEDGPG